MSVIVSEDMIIYISNKVIDLLYLIDYRSYHLIFKSSL